MTLCYRDLLKENERLKRELAAAKEKIAELEAGPKEHVDAPCFDDYSPHMDHLKKD